VRLRKEARLGADRAQVSIVLLDELRPAPEIGLSAQQVVQTLPAS
jgi:hypothetical protein